MFSRITKLYREKQRFEAKLIIRDLSLADSGKYKIQAKNQEGKTSDTCDIDVEKSNIITWPVFEKHR